MVEYLHNTIIPEMVKNEIHERTSNNLPGLDEDVCRKINLHCCRLTKLCPGTVYRWLRLLGFTYEAQRKGYYVDGHKKPETVTCRKDFVFKLFEWRNPNVSLDTDRTGRSREVRMWGGDSEGYWLLLQSSIDRCCNGRISLGYLWVFPKKNEQQEHFWRSAKC